MGVFGDCLYRNATGKTKADIFRQKSPYKEQERNPGRLKNQSGGICEENQRGGTLLKEIEKDLREKGGYLCALKYSQNTPIRIEIHTSSFQYRQALFPRQLLTSKIKDAGVIDEYGDFSEEYLDLYYSLPWESYCVESMRLESLPLFDSNYSLDDEKY